MPRRAWFLLIIPEGVRRVAGTLLVLVSLGFAGCGGYVCNPPRTHIVMAGRLGEPIDPATYKMFPRRNDLRAEKGAETYKEYTDKIFEGIVGFCGQDKPSPCRVLMYFHGGLNSQEEAVQRAAELKEKIKDSNFYPIFVNWNSSLWSTYRDHLAHVRKGVYFERLSVPLAPYVFAVDEAKSIAEAPSAWGTEFRHTFLKDRLYQATEAYQNLVEKHQQEGASAIDVNSLLDCKGLVDQRSFSDRWAPRAAVSVTFWSKLLTLPLAVVAGGTGAWNVLERRTETLFRTEGEFRGKPLSKIEREEGGSGSSGIPDDAEGAALAQFITRFKDSFVPQFCESGSYDPKKTIDPNAGRPVLTAKFKSCQHPIEITLVGHSMGTIIIDRMLRYVPDLEVKNIVFMAAATAIEDYQNTINPYLARHSETQMYHLVLHPRAETSEPNYFDFAPRGSLLVWIDNFFTDPSTPLGRRVGRFSNLFPELTFTPPNIRGQVHVKVFRVGTPVSCWSPQKHGDFGSFPFWDEKFWCPSVDSGEGSPVRRLDNEHCPAVVEVQRQKPFTCKALAPG
jgi:hypothetical protein